MSSIVISFTKIRITNIVVYNDIQGHPVVVYNNIAVHKKRRGEGAVH